MQKIRCRDIDIKINLKRCLKNYQEADMDNHICKTLDKLNGVCP